MNRKAIVLPYVAYQNEPSRPLAELVDIDEDNLRKECHQLFLKVFKGYDFSIGEIATCQLYTTDKYGDVSYGNGDMWIFLTYVNQ